MKFSLRRSLYILYYFSREGSLIKYSRESINYLEDYSEEYLLEWRQENKEIRNFLLSFAIVNCLPSPRFIIADYCVLSSKRADVTSFAEIVAG